MADISKVKALDGITYDIKDSTAREGLSNKADKVDTVLTTTLSRGRKANTIIGTGSLAFGYNVTASGNYATAEGYQTTAYGWYSHAEGEGATANGGASHAEGIYTDAEGGASHAEGEATTASGTASHAEGNTTTAEGWYSHTEGQETVAVCAYQHVFGTFNEEDPMTEYNEEYGEYEGEESPPSPSETKGDYIEIVGNGTDGESRSNARTLDWSGNERLAGMLYVNADSDGTGGNAVLTASAFVSPAFTGTPTAPTAVSGTSTTQIATTAFVQAEISAAIPTDIRPLTNAEIDTIFN